MPEGSLASGIRFNRRGIAFVADHTGHNVLRLDPGTRRFDVFAHEPTMNQPNDLAMSQDGTMWASDPSWAKSTGQVWRIDRNWKVTRVASDMGTTNGIDVSPDGHTLYVNESVQGNLWAFQIERDRSLSGKRLIGEVSHARPGWNALRRGWQPLYHALEEGDGGRRFPAGQGAARGGCAG